MNQDLKRLEQDIAELTDRYDEGTSHGPGLLYQLEDVERRTLASIERTEGKRGKPGSKPPMPLDAVALAQKIKQGAMDWCFSLGAEHVKDGYDSLRRLPAFAAQADDDTLHDLCSDVGRWRSTARTVLGYQEAAVEYRNARCPYCQGATIRARPEAVRAWCSDSECRDPETGRQPVFSRVSLLVLIQEAS